MQLHVYAPVHVPVVPARVLAQAEARQAAKENYRIAVLFAENVIKDITAPYGMKVPHENKAADINGRAHIIN